MDSFHTNNKLSRKRSPRDPRLSLDLVLLTALSDDDDDIRRMAAKIVSRISGTSCIPEAAVQAWVKWIKKKYTTRGRYEDDDLSDDLLVSVMDGIYHPRTRFPDKRTRRQWDIAEELGLAMKEDNALFVEESQNLYIDEVQETKMWLSFFDDDPRWSMRYYSDKIIWDDMVHELHTMRDFVRKYDGPFGWASKPQVFGLLMKIILATQVVVKYDHGHTNAIEEHYGPQYLTPDAPVWEIVEAADLLWAIGKRNGMHPLIMAELQQIYPTKCPTVGHCKRCDDGLDEKELEVAEKEADEFEAAYPQ